MTLLSIAAALLAVLAPVASTSATQDAVTPGTITVEPIAHEAVSPEAKQLFADAVERALVDANFLALPADNPGRYVTRMKISRRAQGSVAVNDAEPPAAGNVGNWGARLRVTLPSGKRQIAI